MSAPEYHVVVSFRAGPSLGWSIELDRWDVERMVRHAVLRSWGDVAGLDVAVREIGATGESSADEGRVEP